MSLCNKASSAPGAVFSGSAFFVKTSASFKNHIQDNFSGDDLRGAMAIFPEFFRTCDICNKNVRHEKMARTIEAATEYIPRDIKGWYKCEFGMK